MRLSLRLAFVIGGAIASTSQCVFAQSITLDGTLGAARSLNGPRYTIQQTDGQTVGNNLFHSFGRFNLNTGETATFQSGVNIQNIISRVTGRSRSTIDGLISAGNVNLFLINPSGIVFGQNARLNIGSTTRGSFVATTLDGLVWSNGGQFSATNPGGPSSLLTLVGDPSGFLSSLRPPQPISTNSGSNLSVLEGQSLLLLGGNLTLDGTKLSAPSGQIELASVTGAGTVGLGINGNILKLNISDNITRGDIFLVNDSQVVVSPKNARNAGDINIKGGNISINNQSTTALDASNSGQKARTGNISLDATGSIFLTGPDKQVTSVISTLGNGNSLGSGDISLTAKGDISLNDSFLNVSNFGGNAGNISLEANNSISLANNSSLVSTAFRRGNSGNITVKSLSGSVSFQNSLVSTGVGSPGAQVNPNLGNAGDISISGRSVSVTGGAEISSRAFSGLNSGSIQITGTDQVEISGRAPLIPRGNNDRASTYLYTTLATTSEKSSRGTNAGDINITTKNLRVSDGAILRAESSSNAVGGNITIIANTFELTSGGQLSTTAFSTGNAGDVNLNVKDRVIISGVDPDRSTVFNLIADDFTQNNLRQRNRDGSPRFTPEQAKADAIRRAQNRPDLNPNRSSASGIFANTSGNSTAKGGDINITTGQLQIEKAGSLTVSSPSGQAGNLTIAAKEIRLNSGNLTAETAIDSSDPGANITLQGLDLLLLQNGSRISAKANPDTGAKGGNIRIDAKNGFVVAPLLQNSDIIASASQGRGGNITISSRRIFGLTQGQATFGNRTNDVDVSSQYNSAGTVTFNTSDIDQSLGLMTFPTVVVEASRLVDTSCTTASQTKFNELTVTGRGGLPPSPYDLLTSDAIWSDNRLPNIVSLQKLSESQRLSSRRVPLETKDHIAIVPATGWVFNNKGEVTLIADSSEKVLPNTSSCPKR
jgi:filamentous hemagglutinin family protein